MRGAEIPELEEGGKPKLVGADQGAAVARDGLPPDGSEPTDAEANNALASMLSATPPPLPTEVFDMPALAERMGVPEFKVTLRALTEREMELVSDRSTKKPTPEQRKRGITQGPPDFQRMKRLLVAVAMVDPNLNDERLRTPDAPTAEHVVLKWFLAGEISRLSELVNDLSGFGEGAVERAKE